MSSMPASPMARLAGHPFSGPAVTAAAGIAAVGLLAVVDPHEAGTYPVCPSISLFGVNCPLCGGLRGVNLLTRGDVAGAVSSNALLPIVVVLAVWAWLAWAARSLDLRWRPSAVPTSPRLWGVLGILAIAYGVARNLPWEPFVALAP